VELWSRVRKSEARLLIVLLGGQILELPFPVFKIALADAVASMPSAVLHPCRSLSPFLDKPAYRMGNVGLGGVLAVGEDSAETADQQVGQLEELAVIVVPVVGMRSVLTVCLIS
jgi:hypothetical protein